MLVNEQTKEIDVHLAEYQALRTENNLYSQRIDRTIGIYLAAIFAIAGYLLRPDTAFSLNQYLKKIQSDIGLAGIFIVIPILNSLLIIRLQTFFLAILALAKYQRFIISPRLSALLGNPVLSWDKKAIVDAKKYWIALRFISQSLFILISEGLSLSILILSPNALTKKSTILMALYIISWGTVILSLLGVAFVFYASITFHKSKEKA